jgi:tRNA (guanosine-2'-O-)-methyltransferase
MSDLEKLESLLTPERFARLRTVLENRVSNVTVVLENLHKVHNMSAILRTCESFGIQDVHVVPQPGEGKVFRTVTQGCHGWLTIRRHKTIDSCFAVLKEKGYRVLAAALGENAVPLQHLNCGGKIALVFSNELKGAGDEVIKQVDGLVAVPMAGFSQSLNVSVAAGIIIHHVLMTKEAQGDVEGLSVEEAEGILSRWVQKSIRNVEVVLAELEGRR